MHLDLPDWWHTHRKAVWAFAIAVAGGAVAQGLIVGRAAATVTVIIGALATIGVTRAINTTP